MGQKFSQVGKKILSVAGAVAKAVPNVVEGALEGAGTGTAIEPGIGTVLGGIGGGLMRGIGEISPIIDAVKGNSQDTPLKPEHLANVISDGANAVQSAAKLKQLLPQQHQDKLDNAIANAANGKIAQNVVKTGKFAAATAGHVLNQVYKGKVRPDAAERLFSPVMDQARAMLSPQERQELRAQREVAYMANLNPVQAAPPVAVEA